MCLLPDCPHGFSRRSALQLGLRTAVAASLSRSLLAPLRAKEIEPRKPRPHAIKPEAALKRLMQGNARYVVNRPAYRDFNAGRARRVSAQYPIAAILSCSDSRVAPEFAFDQGPGNLFVVRLAGNFANDDGLASFEYAVKYLGVPLIFVLGHSNCGAVSSAIKVAEDKAELPGHLPELVDAIKPAVEAAQAQSPKDLFAAATRENVALNVKRLKEAPPLLADYVERGEVGVTGGVYDLATGKITLLP